MIRKLIDSAADGYQVSEQKKRMLITVIGVVWIAILIYCVPTIFHGLAAIPTYNEVTTDIKERAPGYSSAGRTGFADYGKYDCSLVYGMDQETCVKEKIEDEFFGPIYKIAIPLLLFGTLGIWLLLKVFFWIQSSEKTTS